MKRIFTRPKSLKDAPFHYCPGCGHSIIHRLVAEVIDELGNQGAYHRCASRRMCCAGVQLLRRGHGEAPHGRAAAVATGIKRVLPDRVVFTYQGDGDIAAIGTAETIHAANRGERVTCIFVNNAVYGMTGGQMAPTTVIGSGNHHVTRRKTPSPRRLSPRSQRNAGSRCRERIHREDQRFESQGTS